MLSSKHIHFIHRGDTYVLYTTQHTWTCVSKAVNVTQRKGERAKKNYPRTSPLQVCSRNNRRGSKKKCKKKEEMYTTSCGSTVVTHLSTRQTDSGLTSQIGRVRCFSLRMVVYKASMQVRRYLIRTFFLWRTTHRLFFLCQSDLTLF